MTRRDLMVAAIAIAGSSVVTAAFYSFIFLRAFESPESVQVVEMKSQSVSIRKSEPNGYQIVDAFFASDRNFNSESSRARGALKLGVVKVSIPFEHKMGEIERPKWYRFELSENPRKHMVLLGREFLDQKGFYAKLSASLVGEETKSAFVFVHGYRVSFEDAALRTAQISVDLQIRSVPVFYSWPSQGKLASYTVDESNAEWTEPHLRAFLEQFADKSGVDAVFVVAHSMGTRPAVRALVSLLEKRPELRPKFRELILAAPDIDADVFKRDIAPRLVEMQQQMTLYASSNDAALAASHGVHGNPRAGEAGPNIVVTRGIETIDASRIDTDFLGHSYYADARPLLTDIAMVLQEDLPAERRPWLSGVAAGTDKYWVFRR